MSVHMRRTFALPAGFALVLSLAATSAIASAMPVDGSEDSDVKSAACSMIGCANGSRECGEVGGTIKSGVPPFVGEVSVSYTCYEGKVNN